ncbi:hypothetical protein LCGC14_2659350, partial [marine sediment metagenome]
MKYRIYPNEDDFKQKKFKEVKIRNEIVKIDLSMVDDIIWLNEHGYA